MIVRILLTAVLTASTPLTRNNMDAALPKGYVCYRAESLIRIDGRLDDPAWKNARWTDAFVDIEGDAKPRPRWRTRVKMLWDDGHLYVGAELEEPHVWATLTEHDSVIFQDNDFEMFIDPDSDNHDYYEIEINALNTEWDLRLPKPYRDGGPALNEWEIPGLKTAVHVDGTLNDPRDRDRGWSVEMAIPWKVLGEYARCPAPPRDGDQWRVNFSRVEWDVEIVEGKYRKVPGRPEHNWVWSPQGVIDMHRPEKWGYVQFSTAPPGRAKFRPDPTLPVREFLMRVYYAQKDFHEKNGRWASSLAELSPAPPSQAKLAGPVQMRADENGFEAVAEWRVAKGKTARLHVRQDSRLWAE
jgi:hypothetical protein